jgi:hypothetical protein
MSAPEFHLQRAICQALDVGWPRVFYFAIPNGAALCGSNDPAGRVRAKREIAKLKITGLVPGVPDLMLMWDGGCGMLEIKSDSGRLSPEQKEIGRRLLAIGHRVEVCRSLTDLEQILDMWGAPCRISPRMSA